VLQIGYDGNTPLWRVTIGCLGCLPRRRLPPVRLRAVVLTGSGGALWQGATAGLTAGRAGGWR